MPSKPTTSEAKAPSSLIDRPGPRSMPKVECGTSNRALAGSSWQKNLAADLGVGVAERLMTDHDHLGVRLGHVLGDGGRPHSANQDDGRGHAAAVNGLGSGDQFQGAVVDHAVFVFDIGRKPGVIIVCLPWL